MELLKLENNLRLFPRYKAATSVLPWMPIFFLFFMERVSLADAVLLSSAYYFSVFILEVPSGYCSDRYGRRPTLIIASIVTVLACFIFALSTSFAAMLVAQVLIAAGMAFQSGSDSALLFDSLRELDREDEYTERETNAQKWSMTALACSCIAGGALGIIDLRLAYVLAMLAAIYAASLSLQFVEPAPNDGSTTVNFAAQMQATFKYFSHPLLAWIIAFYTIGFALQHIPYEFYQPYIKLIGESSVAELLANSSTPFVSGVVISISMAGGAIGAALSLKLLKLISLRNLLLASVALQIIIVAGLSLVLHPAMLTLIMLRNFAMSTTHGPMLGAVAPHVSSAQRATFLSMLSLSGRASFAIVLAILSFTIVGDDELNWEALSRIFSASALIGVTVWLTLAYWARSINNQFLSND